MFPRLLLPSCPHLMQTALLAGGEREGGMDDKDGNSTEIPHDSFYRQCSL